MPPIPAGLDAYLPVPSSNQLTRAKVELGRKLFFDKRLSADGTVACASCHDPGFAFGDRRALASGIGGRVGVRRAPRLINRGYGKSFFWDGRAQTLEQQVVQPVANSMEMGSSMREAAARIGVGEEALRDALASYVRTILSGNSAFDRYMSGDSQRDERSRATGSRPCSPARQVVPVATLVRTSPTSAITTPGQERARIGDGLRSPVASRIAGAFKTPSLREAARTPPYMHDGSLATVEDVIEFYDKGGRANPQLDPEIRPLHLTAGKKAALASFVRALNGTVHDGL